MSQKSYDGSPTLYLVPTPIGNLEDITLRAIKVLKNVEVVFAEDTRRTIKLFNFLKIKKKLISAYEHNEEQVKIKMVEYLKNNCNIALVSDGGTPLLCDPGYKCVNFVLQSGYNVVSLPGPSALISALVGSNIQTQPFVFYGFLNSKMSKRKKELEMMKNNEYTIIFYETARRIYKTLEEVLNILGNRKICITREISKFYEEIYRGKISEIKEQVKDVKGEIVVIIEGKKNNFIEEDLDLLEHVDMYINSGYSIKEAVKNVAKKRNVSKKDLYKKYHIRK
ncbi:MAG: 16S rRNA (cytidine(1402)-2'-O)-methyltransferase [Bacilli bacterium]|jgi:16S rRNA (cytidine1402-2'-O)-methyltransferase